MKPLSLKLRAIRLLSQREHSLLELKRKLLYLARETQRKAARSASADARREETAGEPTDPNSDLTDDSSVDRDIEETNDPRQEVTELLVWLQGQGYLDEARFIESRVHARSQRFGSLRIKQELAQHGLSLSADRQTALNATEFERAQALWQRKFHGVAADDLAAQAKQSRFLAARGFAPEVIRRVLRAPTLTDSE